MKLKRVLSLVVAITLIAGCINLGTWHALSYQEAQNPFALMTDGKDSSKPTKYIVKYKSDRRAKFNKKAGEYISKVNSLSLTDAANDYDVLTPEGRMSPSQFTDVLREKDAGKEIEWIIPDYTMTLSEVTAEEDTVATSADDATPKVESKEDNVNTDANNNQEVTQEHSEDGGEEHGSSDEPDVEKQPDTDKESEGDEPDASDEPEIEGQPDADKQPEVKDGQRDIIVAVIDTGVDITHPMISGRLWTNPDETYNGVDDDGNGYIDDVNACNVIDKNGIVFDSERALDSTHGTHVAGLIAKLSAENQVSVKIMPIKAFSDGAGYTSDVLSAIEYATANGADIINLSFGSTEQNPALAEVIAASNALFVCAAGNGRENIDEVPVYPASLALPQILSVAAVNADDGFSYFSNYGTTTVDIAAPGRNIESALPGSIVGEMTGTSVSAAMVSAYAAITLAMDAQLTPISAKEKLIATSDRLSNLQDKVDGGRRLNAKNIIAGIEVTDITQVSAADDFDVASYTPLVESAAFELFTKKKATKIETGDGFCLALLEDGTVWAWGKNNHGQLGNNTLINSYYPVRVIGLSNITAISAGNGHAMAMDSNRKIWSWGDNAYGQLGLGDHVDRKIAQQVTAGVSGSDNSNERVVLGGNFSIVHGMTAGGEVNLYACGDNTYGQIGNGTFGGSYATFTAVTFGVWNWITDIVAGQAHAFILSNERAYGWGLNSDGQLGNGTYVNVAKPAMQHDLISKVACGDYHTLILKKDGMGYGFGNNGNARIGETLPPGTTEPILKHPNPIYIFQSSTNDPITQISGGATHSGILFKSGEAMLWGSNYSGELGVVTPGEYTGTLQHFTDFTDVTQLSLGKASSAMIRADGTIWMAGDNLYGQRGDESACFVSPQNVPELTGAVDIKTGERTSIALMQGGLVKTWGDNSTNLLGMPDVKFSYKPKQLAGPRNIGWVDPSGIAVDSNSYVYPGGASSMTSKTYHWGGDKTVPTLEVLTIDIDKYSNALHTLLLTKSGEIRDCTIPCTHTYCNGLSGGMTNVKDVLSSANGQAIALKMDGTVWAWGCYANLQATGSTHTPHQITGLSGIVSITMGGNDAYALKSDGTVWRVGFFTQGSIRTHNDATALNIGNSVTEISAGNDHVLMLTKDGKIYSLGSNTYGQLGDRSVYDTETLAFVNELTDVVHVWAGYQNSFAVLRDGRVFSWGNNSDGRLGIGAGLSKFSANRIGDLNKEADDPELSINLGSIQTGHTRLGRINTPNIPDYYTFTVNPGNVYAISFMGVRARGVVTDSAHNIIAQTDDMEKDRLVFDGRGKTYLKISAEETGDYKIIFRAIGKFSNISRFSGGTNHSLALDGDGHIFSWGDNSFGQLGDASLNSRAVPKQIESIEKGVAIAAGNAFSIAALADGSVWSWGKNDYGQLGRISNQMSNEPGEISGIKNVVAVAAGDIFAVALKDDGTVWAWGQNTFGQLGDGMTANSNIPVQVNGLSNIVAIAAGATHALALTGDGRVWAWGYGTSGQLGTGTKSENIPVLIQALSGVKTVNAGTSHSMATTKDGSAYFWGLNASTQLGIVSGNIDIPTKLAGIQGASLAAGGIAHSAVISDDGSMYTMGDNTYGQLGRTGEATASKITNFKCINLSAGKNHILATDFYENIYAWGANESGQLGDSSRTGKSAPVNVTEAFLHNSFDKAAKIKPNQSIKAVIGAQDSQYYFKFKVEQAGEYTILVERGDAVLYNSAQTLLGSKFLNKTTRTLAAGTYYIGISGMIGVSQVEINTKVVAPSKIQSVSASDGFSLVADADGGVWSFGINTYGQLGNDGTETMTIPVQISGISRTRQVSAGKEHSLGLCENGDVYSWGSNSDGQLGVRESTNTRVPSKVIGLSNIVEVAAGNNFSMALKSDGTVYAWGANESGQLGDGTNTNRTSPVRTGVNQNVTKITAGSAFAMALTEDGNIYTWGSNSKGQLGIGNNINKNYPVTTASREIATSISAGHAHAIAIGVSGKTYVWGDNSLGQLGIDAGGSFLTPQEVTALPSAVCAVAGSNESYVILKDKTVYATGENQNGCLGLGDEVRRNTFCKISTLSEIATLAAGGMHCFAISNSGSFFAWGRNENGELGNDAIGQQKSPAPVSGMTNVTHVDAGPGHSLALKNDGTVWTWGMSVVSSDPYAGASGTPTQIGGITGVTGISAGRQHDLFLKNDGTVWAYGHNDMGQLGNANTATIAMVPVQVSGLSNIKAISAGEMFSMALSESGTVYTWGCNSKGQLGIGNTVTQTAPQAISGLSGVTEISAGYQHALAVNASNVYAWGNNECGQLGDGTYTMRLSPTAATMATGTNISAGYNHSTVCDGAILWSCGSNAFGQQGLPIGGNSSTFSLIDGATTSAVAGNCMTLFTQMDNSLQSYGKIGKVACPTMSEFSANQHVLGITNDATKQVWSWGENNFEALGRPTNHWNNAPIEISDAFANNNSFESAIDIGSSFYYVGALNKRNEKRYLKFRVDTPGDYTLKLSGQMIRICIYKNGSEVYFPQAQVASDEIAINFKEQGEFYLEILSAYTGTFKFLMVSGNAAIGQNLIDVHKGVNYDFSFNANGVTAISTLEYSLVYPENDFRLVSACTESGRAVVSVGPVAGTDVNIISISPGGVKFKIAKPGTPAYTGTINTIKLSGIREGQGKVELRAEQK